MKIIVISYSLTGNNNALASSVAKAFSAEHIIVTESKKRTLPSIVLDLLLNRTPKVNPTTYKVEDDELIIFMGPIWMGQVATPLRAYFNHMKGRPGPYAFVSISGGADGHNPKLADELKRRMGKEPLSLIDLHIADLLPPDPKPTKEMTSAYRLRDDDIRKLENIIIKTLKERIDAKG